jgi:small-conductance mechanosensitive channel
MKKILEYKIIELGSYELHLTEIIFLLVLLASTLLLQVILKRFIYRSKSLDTAKKFSINKLSRYFIAVLSFLLGLDILGINISVLLAGSAALLVGVGFGLQNLFNDFISGIILLLDGTLKVGDIIELNNLIYKVEEISFRTTRVIGRDDDYIILPNSELTGNKIINWTHNQIASRARITIGVGYSTDVILLMDILKSVTCKHEKVLKEPEPFVRFDDYGESALIFAVFFYTEEIFRVERIKSEIRIEIFKVLKERGIEIPFPQRVVHIKNH